MAYLLKSESGAQTGWIFIAWPIIRRLAENFGWQPCGTLPPVGWDAQVEKVGEWPRHYTSNDGQLVTAQDALALGTALGAALASDEFDPRIRGLFWGTMAQLRSTGLPVTDDETNVSEWRES
jgi:hypothetical protein